MYMYMCTCAVSGLSVVLYMCTCVRVLLVAWYGVHVYVCTCAVSGVTLSSSPPDSDHD